MSSLPYNFAKSVYLEYMHDLRCPQMTIFSSLLSFRYPHQCPALGVHSACTEETKIQVHGVLGETRGGTVSFQQRTGICSPLGQASKPTSDVVRQGRTGSSLLLQEKYLGASRGASHLQIHKET